MNVLMNFTFSIYMIFTAAIYADGGGTSANAPIDARENQTEQMGMLYRMIPFEYYQTADGLPPLLNVTFQIKCFQRFVRLVRYNISESSAGKVTIVVGALVQELPRPSICSGAENITLDAGHTYSGREHEIVTIINN